MLSFFATFKKQRLGPICSIPSEAETIQEHLESANSAKAKIWPGIQIRISRLIRIRMSAGSPPPKKMYWIHSLIGISHFA